MHFTNIKYFTVVLNVLILIPVVGAAELHINNIGQLTGASNVDLGEAGFYDVTFVDGSCIDLFDGCDELSDFFISEELSNIAAQALLQQVFIDIPLGAFDSDPSLIFGCENDIRCIVHLPTRLLDTDPARIAGDTAINSAGIQDDGVGSFSAVLVVDTTFFDDIVWARWQTSPVPIPAGWFLFLSAISLFSITKFMNTDRKEVAR